MKDRGRAQTSRLIANLGSIALLLTACQAVAGPPTQETDTQNGDTEVSRVEQASVVVEASGEVDVHWEQEAEITIVSMTSTEEVRLLSVGLADMQVLGDVRERFRFALDVFGDYDGPGTYEISPATGTGGDLHSTAFLVYARVVDPDAAMPYTQDNLEYVADFNIPQQTCVVEVAAGEVEGSLICPELADAEGNTIELRATWRVVT